MREFPGGGNHLELGSVYVQKGDDKNGIESMRRAHALAGDEPLFDAVLGYGLARAGQRAEASLRSDPRFQDLRRRVGLEREGL